MYDIIILGAGGMGRESAEIIEDSFAENPEYKIKGFLSDVPDVLDGYATAYPLLGAITDCPIGENDRFVLAMGDVAGRRRIAETIKSRGGNFLTFIHPTAKIYRTATLGEGVIIFPFVNVGANATVGDFCLFNVYSSIGHDVSLGKFSELCPYAVLAGSVVTGEECFFATHANVGPRTRLGDRVVVSLGSAVQKSQDDDALMVGVPAKKLRKIGMH